MTVVNNFSFAVIYFTATFAGLDMARSVGVAGGFAFAGYVLSIGMAWMYGCEGWLQIFIAMRRKK